MYVCFHLYFCKYAHRYKGVGRLHQRKPLSFLAGSQSNMRRSASGCPSRVVCSDRTRFGKCLRLKGALSNPPKAVAVESASRRSQRRSMCMEHTCAVGDVYLSSALHTLLHQGCQHMVSRWAWHELQRTCLLQVVVACSRASLFPGQGHRESRDSKGKGKSSGAGQLVRLRLLSDSLRRMVILSQTVW